MYDCHDLFFRKGKEVPPSFKQFFSSSLALMQINLSGTKLSPEPLKWVVNSFSPELLKFNLLLWMCLREGKKDIQSQDSQGRWKCLLLWVPGPNSVPIGRCSDGKSITGPIYADADLLSHSITETSACSFAISPADNGCQQSRAPSQPILHLKSCTPSYHFPEHMSSQAMLWIITNWSQPSWLRNIRLM